MRKSIYQEVERYCRETIQLLNGQKIVVGVSGGADSLFLLCALLAMKKTWQLELYAVHVNHGIRGKEADADETFVKDFCSQRGVVCKVFREDIPKLSKEWGMTEEEAGRVFRYQCFEQVRVEEGYDVIAVAHHQNDQAETILFQMLRGSSLRGLAGMHPKREHIIRPLLEITREEIESALSEEKIVYCRDSTNHDISYSRNKIRLQIIPLLKKLQPRAVEHLVRMGQDFAEIQDYLEQERDRIYQSEVRRTEGGVEISHDAFVKCHVVIQREIVLRMTEEMAGRKKDITSSHIANICEVFRGETGKSIDLPYALFARKSYERLGIYRKEQEICTNVEKSVEIPIVLGNSFRIKESGGIGKKFSFTLGGREKFSQINLKKYCTKCFDYDKMSSMPIFRYPQAGDYLWLEKNGKTKKLSRFFIDMKIPLEKRQQILVLAIEHHVLWVPEIDRCSAYYFVSENTKQVLYGEVISE